MTDGAPSIQETEQASENDSQDRLRKFGRWLLIILLVLLLLLLPFCCGQLALLGITPPTAEDTGSNLEADYGIWSFAAIPRVLPEIIEEIREDRGIIPDEVTIPGRIWPLDPVPPTAEPTSTNTPRPELPEPPEPTTPEPPQPTSTASLSPTTTASPTTSPTPTSPWIWLPSSTPTDTPRPPTDIPSATMTSSPEPTETSTNTPAPSETPSITPSPIPIFSDTPTPSLTLSLTPSLTPSETQTPTESLVPSDTPTFTDTPLPCGGNVPPGEPNIGPSDGVFAEFACGSIFIIDLVANGYAPIDTTIPDGNYDIRFYERTSSMDPTGIAFDWITLQVGTGPSGACASGSWFTALDWGDMNRDNNGHLGGSYPENNNEYIPLSDLHGGFFQTGVSIDLDAGPLGIPNQQYPCVRVISPINWPDNDGSEMDALEILP